MSNPPNLGAAQHLMDELKHPDRTVYEPAWNGLLVSEKSQELRAYIHRLATMRYGLDQSDEEEVMQDTFFNLYLKVRSGSYDPAKGSLFEYARGIARNCAKKLLKAKMRALMFEFPPSNEFETEDLDEDDLPDLSIPDPQETVEVQECLLYVWKLTEPIDRTILILSIAGRLTSDEIAQRLNLKPGTVRQKLSRCLRKIYEPVHQRFGN